MALERRKGGVWYVDITAPNGRRIRHSTRTQDKAAAQEYHDRLKSDLWRQSQLGETPDRSWKEAVVKFLQETTHKASRRDDISRLRWLDKHLGHLSLSEITRDILIRIGDQKRRESSPATANRHLAVVRTILKKAVREWGWLKTDPQIKLFKEAPRRIRWITYQEAETLIRELPEHLADMVRFSLATGLRESNVTGLEWTQVDLTRRTAWVHPDQAKNRRAITVPLNDSAIETVQKQVGKHHRYVFTYNGKRVTRINNHAWRKALHRAGIEDFRVHDLRHTWASWHVQAGTPLHALQELGGWESVEMVRRYAHLGGDHLASHAANIKGIYGRTTVHPLLKVVGR